MRPLIDRAWTDTEILRALDLRDGEGLTCSQIGKRLGRGKNAVIGMFNRIRRDEQPGAEHLDGTLRRRWWAL